MRTYNEDKTWVTVGMKSYTALFILLYYFLLFYYTISYQISFLNNYLLSFCNYSERS